MRISKKKIQELWKNKWKIIKALFYFIQNNFKTRKLSKERTAICKSNKCGHYDALGSSENAFIKGKPACEICGCNIKILTSSPESVCSLQELNQTPLWTSTNN